MQEDWIEVTMELYFPQGTGCWDGTLMEFWENVGQGGGCGCVGGKNGLEALPRNN